MVDPADWTSLLGVRVLALAAREEATPVAVSAFTAAADALVAQTRDRLIAEVYLPLLRRMARGPLTVAQLGESLDGAIATAEGDSHYINGAEALDHLHRLRALSEAVIVGAETVVRDDPLLTTRRVPGTNPIRVVIDPNRRVPPTRRVFGSEAPTLVMTRSAETGDEEFHRAPTALAIASDGRALAPAAILAALAYRGARAVLIEGGCCTVSAFIDAGQVDVLHLLVAPILLGPGTPALRLKPSARVAAARRLAVAAHQLGDDVLLDCRLR